MDVVPSFIFDVRSWILIDACFGNFEEMQTTAPCDLPSGAIKFRGAEGSLSFLRMWRVTDLAWPSTAQARDAAVENVVALQRHGVGVTSGVDAFNVDAACRNILDIPDVDTVGLVLWSGIHPRRHDGMNARQQEELKSLHWSHTKFITAALDSISSALPQATVIACDQGKWADEIMFPLDHKPLATFQTLYGDVDGARFRSESSGFDGRHVRQWNTDEFVGCGFVAPFLHDILGRSVVDVPELAVHVAAAGLHVLFIGEYTCAQARHCLRRALTMSQRPRMLCYKPWEFLPAPKRRFKRGSGDLYSLHEYRHEASTKVRRKFTEDRWMFSDMHAANIWTNAIPRGRAGSLDFGAVMWPSLT